MRSHPVRRTLPDSIRVLTAAVVFTVLGTGPTAQTPGLPHPKFETIPPLPCGCPPAWQLIGNSNTFPLTQFLGTIDNKPLSLRVFNTRTMQYAYASNATYHSTNVLGGTDINAIATGTIGATLAGGGQDFFTGLDFPNVISADFGTIGGGSGHTLSGASGTIAGGALNAVSGPDAVVSGGRSNTAGGQAAAIGGGDNNFANGFYACVSGGQFNSSSAAHATIGGGNFNLASGAAATVAGGQQGDAANDYASVGGGFGNSALGAHDTVSGGNQNSANGTAATIGGGKTNAASAPYATVGGGEANTAGQVGATAAGGQSNNASGQLSTVSGGFANSASDAYATVGGGLGNGVSGAQSTIAGGYQNDVSGLRAVIGGGELNTVSGNWGTIPGGKDNVAAGEHSFAAGLNARAMHQGAFVWADSTSAALQSTAIDQFSVRAAGGTRIFSNAGATTGVLLAPGAGTWSSASDRESKENIEAVDGRVVLERLVEVPIATWNYRSQDDAIRHMGPMAQDFYAAFALGLGEKTIDTIDHGGVALAAIQGLNALVQEQATRIAALEAKLSDLEQRGPR